jgi:hypothetical protein
MPELIDRQSALSVCKEYCWLDDEDFIEGYNTAIKDMREAIKELPTIEPEVRHGRWIDVPDDNTRVAKCSLCGFWQRTNCEDKTGKHLIHNAVYRYFAGCGARMDGGADNG